MIEIIKLSKLNQENRIRLYQFFKNQSDQGIAFWKKGETFKFEDGTPFQFKNSVYQRHRKNKNGVRYEVISRKNAIGKGGYGEVRLIKGTLALEANKHVFKKESHKGERRVVKIQSHLDEENTVSHLQNEYQLSKAVGYLGVKKPTFANPSKKTSYFTMRKLPGKSLYDILEDDQKNHNLTLKQRIELTKALLSCLKRQVSDKKIIHRDIKPDNILVEFDPSLVINIIDFGLSTKSSQNHNEIFGTTGYIAPEVLQGSPNVNKKADLYSMARIIALIWNVNDDSYNCDLNQYVNTVTTMHEDQLLEGIFTSISGLTPNQETKIKSALLAMLNPDPDKRISVEGAINRFKNLDSEAELNSSLANHSLCSGRSSPNHHFFSANPHRQETNAFLTEQQVKSINELIFKLTKEFKSQWPYPNKDRKKIKIDGLNQLLELCKNDTIGSAIETVKKKYPDIIQGRLSTRTKDLLVNLQTSAIQLSR